MKRFAKIRYTPKPKSFENMRRDEKFYHSPAWRKVRLNHYYRDAVQVANSYRCLGAQDEDYEVTVPGSGVMGWRGDLIDLRYDLFKEKNMADVEVARLAHQQRQRIVCLKHHSGYIIYNDVGHDTIYNEQFGQCRRQTEIVNGILFNEYKRI
jgi:hypothetical protein